MRRTRTTARGDATAPRRSATRVMTALARAAGVSLAIVLASQWVPSAGWASVAGQAMAVWGQPNFVSQQCRRPGPRTLCGPSQAMVDRQGNLWVDDFNNNRVLMYAPGQRIAGKVFGQYGSFRSNACNRDPPPGTSLPPAPNRYTLCEPFGVAVDAAGTLYIADSINNRILVYRHAANKGADAPADLVIGQPSFHATASNDVPAGGSGAGRCPAPAPASRCTLSSPLELSLDAVGDLVVPDVDNNRVLLWHAATLAAALRHPCVPRCHTPAAQVWGQYGSFTGNAANNPTIPAAARPQCPRIAPATPASACTLSGPSAAVLDAAGNLFVADTANNRVLEYQQALGGNRLDAQVVYGQDGQFDGTRPNRDGTSDGDFWHPLGLALDPDGNLWVSDFDNMRVLMFPSPASTATTHATQVLGQQGSFATNSCGVTATTVCGPTSIFFDASGHAFVADGFNSRVLEFVQ